MPQPGPEAPARPAASRPIGAVTVVGVVLFVQLADADARLGNDLRQAITRDQMFVLYQPIVELPHGRLAGVEALVRWRHPEHGLVSPAVFIPPAERNGTIVEMGRWIGTGRAGRHRGTGQDAGETRQSPLI